MSNFLSFINSGDSIYFYIMKLELLGDSFAGAGIYYGGVLTSGAFIVDFYAV